MYSVRMACKDINLMFYTRFTYYFTILSVSLDLYSMSFT